MANRATKRAETSDLISRLPDELLTHILSFVPSVISVRTCVLSKRWSRLWISVPNIDFIGFSGSVSKFQDFIERFLSLNRVMSVRTIEFAVEYEYEDPEVSCVNARIAAISERDAEEVRLSFPVSYLEESDELGFPIHSFPDKFFIQNNLVILELNVVILKVPQLVCFPNLKQLDLDRIRFFDDNSLNNLLSGSPVIENLDINLDEGNASHTLYICSSSLCNLRLVTESYDNDDHYKIVIDTPNLRDLSISDFHFTTYNVINLSSLESAHLRFTKKEAFLELLTQINHVKELDLDGVYEGFDNTTLVFNNLIHLEVDCRWMKHSETLFHLFKCTPNLVTFIITKPSFADCALTWSEPHQVPQCFLSSIESVEFKGVGDSDQDMPMISYILKNAMVLKKLSLRCSPDRVTDNKFLLTLLTLPRSSAIATCQVDYTFK